ncbi:hypothetical protein [Mesoplasma melaleucae]|uniref:hypothetical protein n=1 Tax=Mesoplasma melaleucae TaxID=81459 RepID=UPI0018E0B2BA|nr:hypothetical protein [Mesoplasma melaleucae]
MKNDFKIKMFLQTKKKQFKIWSAFTILLLIIAFIILISWILKWNGASITHHDGTKDKIKVLGIFDLFLAPIHGFVSGAKIIVFFSCIGWIFKYHNLF